MTFFILSSLHFSMLFNTGSNISLTPCSSNSKIYPAYSVHLTSPHSDHSSASHHQLKSFQQTALVSSMLQSSNSQATHSFCYNHNLESTTSSAVTAATTPIVRVPSNGEAKLTGTNTNESPGNTHHAHQISSPSSSSGGHCSGNQNEVRTVMLCSVPIVSLVMDGQERLCLAQISNTLLKNFSYNEIHNRLVYHLCTYNLELSNIITWCLQSSSTWHNMCTMHPSPIGAVASGRGNASIISSVWNDHQTRSRTSM